MATTRARRLQSAARAAGAGLAGCGQQTKLCQLQAAKAQKPRRRVRWQPAGNPGALAMRAGSRQELAPPNGPAWVLRHGRKVRRRLTARAVMLLALAELRVVEGGARACILSRLSRCSRRAAKLAPGSSIAQSSTCEGLVRANVWQGAGVPRTWRGGTWRLPPTVQPNEQPARKGLSLEGATCSSAAARTRACMRCRRDMHRAGGRNHAAARHWHAVRQPSGDWGRRSQTRRG